MLGTWFGGKAQNEILKYTNGLDFVILRHKIDARPVMFIAEDTAVIPIEEHIHSVLSALKGTKNSQTIYNLIENDYSFSVVQTEINW